MGMLEPGKFGARSLVEVGGLSLSGLWDCISWDCTLMSSGRALGTDASVQLSCVGAEPKYQGPTVNRAPVTGTSLLPRVQSLK